MAIYNVDTILESEVQTVEESEIDNESVLDGMLEACESMMNTLNESNARRRTLEVYRNKEKQYQDNANIYGELMDAAYRVGNRDMMYKYNNKRKDALSNKNKYGDAANRYDPTKSPYFNGGRRPGDMSEKLKGQKAEERYKEDLKKLNNDAVERNGVKPVHDKPGFYKDLYEKKKAIKETCLTILSVIDDI